MTEQARIRKATLADVAKVAGVSGATVSYVLNGRSNQGISEETRQRVLQASKDLRYRANGLAKSLIRGETRTIGIVGPSMGDAFYSGLVKGIQDICLDRDYHVMLGHSAWDHRLESKQVQVLLEHQVDALVCLSVVPAGIEHWLDQVVADGLPCIMVDDDSHDERADCIISDDHGGALDAVRHLIGLGHRRIGHIAGNSTIRSAQRRRQGYERALSEAGLPLDPALIVGFDFFPESAVAAVDALLGLPEPPTAIFAANDFLAEYTVSRAQSLGRRIPQDLSVVGFFNGDLARGMGLTTIAQEPIDIGRAAAERLFDRLAQPGLPPCVQVIPTRLVIRQTTTEAS